MANAELKTKRTTASVEAFLGGVDEARREDCRTLVAILREATGAEPKMWGASIVGFGDFHYVYESGRENDWFEVGFSPRKKEITVYLCYGDLERRFAKERAQLGKHKVGKGCLYLKRLADVDLAVLRRMIESAVADLRGKRR